MSSSSFFNFLIFYFFIFPIIFIFIKQNNTF